MRGSQVESDAQTSHLVSQQVIHKLAAPIHGELFHSSTSLPLSHRYIELKYLKDSLLGLVFQWEDMSERGVVVANRIK